MITSVEQTGQRDAYGLSETSVTVFVRHPKVKGIESRPAANMRFTKKKKFQQIRTWRRRGRGERYSWRPDEAEKRIRRTADPCSCCCINYSGRNLFTTHHRTGSWRCIQRKSQEIASVRRHCVINTHSDQLGDFLGGPSLYIQSVFARCQCHVSNFILVFIATTAMSTNHWIPLWFLSYPQQLSKESPNLATLWL